SMRSARSAANAARSEKSYASAPIPTTLSPGGTPEKTWNSGLREDMAAASQELSERAKLLISERKYQEAVRACRRALLSQPDQVEVRLLLGEALLALERYDEVRVEMMALARKLPNRVEVHRLLGEA